MTAAIAFLGNLAFWASLVLTGRYADRKADQRQRILRRLNA